MNDTALYMCCLDHNFRLNYREYPTMSHSDVNNFKDRILSISNNEEGIECDRLYDPIVDPLVQSSLAHFLYMKKNQLDLNEYSNGDNIPDRMPFPSYTF